MSKPVLEFNQVSLRMNSGSGIELKNLKMVCRQGGLVLVEVGRGLSLAHLPLADAAQGLIFPEQGTVCFSGRDWRKLDLAWADRARGRIGRVFEHPAWLSNLNVDENVTLARRHHTDDAPEKIMTEAAELSQRFNLSPPPALRPPGVMANRLRRYEWVRAFLGGPELIILENPLNGVYTESVPLLLEAVREFRGKNTGFLWVTSDHRVLNEDGLNPDARFRIESGGLVVSG